MCNTFKFLNPHLCQVGLCRRANFIHHPRLAVDNGGEEANGNRSTKGMRNV
jgi:hypothetical protein